VAQQVRLREPESVTSGAGSWDRLTIEEAPFGALRFTSQIRGPLWASGITMNSITTCVGIDVGKDRLDVQIPGIKHFSVDNSRQGLLKLCGMLPFGVEIVLESSGGYERLAVNTLRESGFLVRILNAYLTRQAARGAGHKAKTDKLDAKFLSEGCDRVPSSGEKSSVKQALCDLSRHIQRMKLSAANSKKQRQSPGIDKHVHSSLAREIKFFESEIKRMEMEFVQLVRDSDYACAYRNVLTIPNIGPVTARVLVCELPDDLERFDGGQVSSYAGVAPLDNSSGRRIGHKNIAKGNVRIKAALYVPALGAIKSQLWARQLRQRLQDKGKSHQTIMVAIMRRLLIRVVAVLQRKTPWQPEPPSC